MYGFKVFVSTMILFLVVMLSYAVLKSTKEAGKPVAYMIIAIEILSLLAIWG